MTDLISHERIPADERTESTVTPSIRRVFPSSDLSNVLTEALVREPERFRIRIDPVDRSATNNRPHPLDHDRITGATDANEAEPR